MATASSPDDLIDQLYQLPLDEFTAARNALAKSSGQASLKALEKPTLAAWAVNQLYWHQRATYDAASQTFNPQLTWSLPPGSTQYQLRLTAADGPGANVIRNAETSFRLPAPPHRLERTLEIPREACSIEQRIGFAVAREFCLEF